LQLAERFLIPILLAFSLGFSSCTLKNEIVGTWRVHILCEDGSYFDAYTVFNIKEDTFSEISFPNGMISFCESKLTDETINLPNPCTESIFKYSVINDTLILDSNFIGFRVTDINPLTSIDYFASLGLEINLEKVDTGLLCQPISNATYIHIGPKGQFRNQACPNYDSLMLALDDSFPDDTIAERFTIPDELEMKVDYETGSSADILGSLYSGCDTNPKDQYHIYLYVDRSTPNSVIESILKIAQKNRPNLSIYQGFSQKKSSQIVFQEWKEGRLRN
jgi:hypothetical protein